MNLRTRLILAATIAAAVAALGVAITGITYSRHQLRTEVDDGLSREVARLDFERLVGNQKGGHGKGSGQPDRGGNSAEVIDSTGKLVSQNQYADPLPVQPADLLVASGKSTATFRDEQIGDIHYRVITAPISNGYAVLQAKAVDDIDRTVSNLTFAFAAFGLLGVATAALLATITARKALRPVTDLSNAARDVAMRQDPSLPVPETGGTELAILAHSLNTMLASLAESREHERRLIDDAAHELRTPLTSLRTNIEVLATGKLTDPVDHAELLADLRSQTAEFAALIGDLETVARNGTTPTEPTDCPLEEIVQTAVRRAQRRAGNIIIDLTGHNPGVVHGDRAMLERAILNVLDNAVKWSPANGTVTIKLDGKTITVHDTGPGIAPEDLPHVFDRFWRAPSARSMPGSGLGLAIVQQVIHTHHGTITIASPEARGTTVTITVPTSSAGGMAK
jgi:two-component system, OmpR family, sensor histidine kinase MprB